MSEDDLDARPGGTPIATLLQDLTWAEWAAEIRVVVDREIQEARFNKQPWTPYREMLPLEHVGAMYCGRCSAKRRGRVRATMVSYCTGGPGGRTVLCAKCALPRVPRKPKGAPKP